MMISIIKNRFSYLFGTLSAFIATTAVASAATRCTFNGAEVPCSELWSRTYAYLLSEPWLLFIILAALTLALVMIVFWFRMVIHAIRNPIPLKPLWILILFFLQIVGAIIYYFAVKKAPIPSQLATEAQNVPGAATTPAGSTMRWGKWIAIVLGVGIIALIIFGQFRRIHFSYNIASNEEENVLTTIEGVYARDEYTQITVSKIDDTTIHVEGYTEWRGPNAASGQVNVGDISGDVSLDGLEGTYTDPANAEGCKISFTFSATGLHAEDNDACGGWNANFSGDYRKSAETTAPSDTQALEGLSNTPYTNTQKGVSMYIPAGWKLVTSGGPDSSIAMFADSKKCPEKACDKYTPVISIYAMTARSTALLKKYTTSQQSSDTLQQYAAQTDALDEQAGFVLDAYKKAYANLVEVQSDDVYIAGKPARVIMYTYTTSLGVPRTEILFVRLEKNTVYWSEGSTPTADFPSHGVLLMKSISTLGLVN